ncbi:MAG: ATP-binding protein [Methanomassiliicoccaceae archaeon]|jgi:predicted AAA+ superfamily ATPase|nr:ATP-binding protein [Methanomassiliicoccaceae archaeon]
MEIKRDRYLNRLIKRKWNGQIKVITGIRRCGKSYLLSNLFKDHLISEGVDPKNIVDIALDDIDNEHLREPHALYEHVVASVGNERCYVFLDEIQYVEGFVDVLNGLIRKKNIDVYVTGSNSKMLSKDVLTEFRGRGDIVRIYPLSFSEFAKAFPGGQKEAWDMYLTFGGMPLLLSMSDEEQKTAYLQDLFEEVYLKDIKERNDVRLENELDMMVDLLCSSVGSLTNPLKISNTMKTVNRSGINEETVSKYLGYLEDSFLFERSKRYDLKGKKYFDTPSKYYATDVGLRNARLNFRQQEETHIMENIIFNELKSRGFSVDVGIVKDRITKDGIVEFKQLEIDFIANKGRRRYYIQSAYRMFDAEKKERELRPFLKVRDSFKKIIVIEDDIYPKTDDNGVLTIGIRQFLLDENSLDL